MINYRRCRHSQSWTRAFYETVFFFANSLADATRAKSATGDGRLWKLTEFTMAQKTELLTAFRIARILCWVLVASFSFHSSLFAQQAEAVRRSDSQLAGDWRSKTLAQVKDKIEDGPSPAERQELRAQQSWLQSWLPGKMASRPQSAAAGKAKRKEPILVSPVLDEFHRIANQEDVPLKAKLSHLKHFAAAHPNDLAIKQALVHWIDNDSERRKAFLKEATTLIARYTEHVRQRLGQLASDSRPDATHDTALELEALKTVYHFALYRHVRALAYRELPDVVKRQPIVDPEALDRKIRQAFQRLVDVAGSGRPEFVLIEIRMHRRAGRLATALQLLEANGNLISLKWYLKKRRDLLQELDWEYPFREAAIHFAEEFPEVKAPK